jgi:hypothetical protein
MPAQNADIMVCPKLINYQGFLKPPSPLKPKALWPGGEFERLITPPPPQLTTVQCTGLWPAATWLTAIHLGHLICPATYYLHTALGKKRENNLPHPVHRSHPPKTRPKQVQNLLNKLTTHYYTKCNPKQAKKPPKINYSSYRSGIGLESAPLSGPHCHLFPLPPPPLLSLSLIPLSGSTHLWRW